VVKISALKFAKWTNKAAKVFK